MRTQSVFTLLLAASGTMALALPAPIFRPHVSVTPPSTLVTREARNVFVLPPSVDKRDPRNVLTLPDETDLDLLGDLVAREADASNVWIPPTEAVEERDVIVREAEPEPEAKNVFVLPVVDES